MNVKTGRDPALGTAPVGKLFWKLALPAIAAQLVNVLYNIVDRIYIGHMPQVGSLALTGVGVCLPIIMIISAFSAFVSSGGAPRASIAMGRGDYDQAQRILGGCFTLQVAISLVLTAVLRPLLGLFHAAETGDLPLMRIEQEWSDTYNRYREEG